MAGDQSGRSYATVYGAVKRRKHHHFVEQALTRGGAQVLASTGGNAHIVALCRGVAHRRETAVFALAVAGSSFTDDDSGRDAPLCGPLSRPAPTRLRGHGDRLPRRGRAPRP